MRGLHRPLRGRTLIRGASEASRAHKTNAGCAIRPPSAVQWWTYIWLRNKKIGKARTCSVTRVRNEVPFVKERERENYFLFWRMDIETAKIVRFLQFKLFCEANKKKIWNVRKLIENFAKCKTLHFRKIYKS